MSTPTARNKNLSRTLILLVLFLAVIIGAFVYSMSNKQTVIHKPMQLKNATVFPQPRAIAAFKLTDDLGQPFTNVNLEGHWTWMFFGFTNCPHICPTTMYELKKAYNLIADEKLAQPQIVFISIDPERDTTSRIHQYVTGFNKNFIGATGSKTALAKLTDDLKILYLKTNQSKNYDIDHSGAIMLFNPQGRLTAIFSMPHDAVAMAQDYMTILKQKAA
ncbi:MAG: SCO family protein [Pseudomonadota bacterium]